MLLSSYVATVNFTAITLKTYELLESCFSSQHEDIFRVRHALSAALKLFLEKVILIFDFHELLLVFIPHGFAAPIDVVQQLFLGHV